MKTQIYLTECYFYICMHVYMGIYMHERDHIHDNYHKSANNYFMKLYSLLKEVLVCFLCILIKKIVI